MVTTGDQKPVMIEYRAEGTDGQRWEWLRGVVEWIDYHGRDTFVGMAALTFAILGYVYGIGGWLLIGRRSLAGGLVPCALAVMFALPALAGRGTSKAFPLATVFCVAMYLLGVRLLG